MEDAWGGKVTGLSLGTKTSGSEVGGTHNDSLTLVSTRKAASLKNLDLANAQDEVEAREAGTAAATKAS